MTFEPKACKTFLYAVLFYALLISFSVLGQNGDDKEEKKRTIRFYERAFQLSLFPVISTNRIYSGSYFNKYSLNLFGGLTAGNRNFEIGLITNSHFQSSSGLQFAGL